MWYFGGCSALSDEWLVIYCTVEWASLVSLENIINAWPLLFPQKTTRPCCFPFVQIEIKLSSVYVTYQIKRKRWNSFKTLYFDWQRCVSNLWDVIHFPKFILKFHNLSIYLCYCKRVITSTAKSKRLSFFFFFFFFKLQTAH